MVRPLARSYMYISKVTNPLVETAGLGSKQRTSFWNYIYTRICKFSFFLSNNKNKHQIIHSHSTCISEFIWLYSLATCFGSWSHHQAIHKRVLHYWIMLSIWIHILCFLLCVMNKVIIQRASLTFTIHHYMHRLSSSMLNLNLFKMYKTSIQTYYNLKILTICQKF
jgi:hypothetical protein